MISIGTISASPPRSAVKKRVEKPCARLYSRTLRSRKYVSSAWGVAKTARRGIGVAIFVMMVASLEKRGLGGSGGTVCGGGEAMYRCGGDGTPSTLSWASTSGKRDGHLGFLGRINEGIVNKVSLQVLGGFREVRTMEEARG